MFGYKYTTFKDKDNSENLKIAISLNYLADVYKLEGPKLEKLFIKYNFVDILIREIQNLYEKENK